MNKQIDVLVGCQFGSEGKGLVAAILAKRNKYSWLISVNSAQAGHTVVYNGIPIVTRHIPSAAVVDHNAEIFIGAGAIINLDVFLKEIEMLESNGIPIVDRLHVHQEALVITEDDMAAERGPLQLQEKIGSTNEGVGHALSCRATRSAKTLKSYAIDPHLVRHIANDHFVVEKIHGSIFLEGSQGFGLSNFSKYYPFCTSRDTTTSAFLSYARLNPHDLRFVYGVYRTYPIRVGGNSGPMYNEISWGDVAKNSGYPELIERTTVTQRVRRVGMWDAELAKMATLINGVTHPILTFVNYIDRREEGKLFYKDLMPVTVDFIESTSHDVHTRYGSGWYGLSTDKIGSFITLWD